MKMQEYPILNKINSPADLKRLEEHEVDALCEEIRAKLIETTEQNGGHLASNLGVLELTVALHRVFDSPKDKIIFDVGHQSYVHKLLTGRREEFDTIRTPGGLSGFTKISESEHDAFGAGHSSTSISAALGFAEAEHLKGSDAYTVAVVGDGAFTGGMIHEALNNCDNTKGLRLIIIINENEMSISKNIGGFAKSMSGIRTRPRYFRAKSVTRNVLQRIPLIGRPMVKGIVSAKKAVKNLLYGSNLFENLGLYYLGPIDGNDRRKLETMLKEAKKQDESVVLHIKTVKGRGYEPAEQNPNKYHAVAPRGAKPSGGFSRVFGEELSRLAREDGRICAITAAMADGTGLVGFSKEFPERFFDVGIAEEHAVTFAAGLAADGMRPVAAIYSTFLQRSYDNILHDAALQRLPVVIGIDRAGLNGSDGPTHHGIFDVAFLSNVPNVRIYTPATYDALRLCLKEALESGETAAVRYPNAVENEGIVSAFYGDGAPDKLGVRAYLTGKAPRAAIICHGRIAAECLSAAKKVKEASGYDVAVLLCEYIKPYGELAKAVTERLPDSVSTLAFVEEEILGGGFGMTLSHELRSRGDRREHELFAPSDSFVFSKKGESIFKSAGVDSDTVAEKLIDLL